MKIKTTKEFKKELSIWRNLASDEVKKELIFHKIQIVGMQDNVLFDGYITGDMASIRIKLITIPLWLKWMGFSHLWQAECISSDYMDSYDKGVLPAQSIPISHQSASSFENFFWRFFSKSFIEKVHPFFITSCSLNSVYIPLIDMDKTPLEKEYLIKLDDKILSPLLLNKDINKQ